MAIRGHASRLCPASNALRRAGHDHIAGGDASNARSMAAPNPRGSSMAIGPT